MGFLPIMTFDWQKRSSLTRKTPATERLSRSEAQEFANRRAEAVAWAKSNLFKAQASYKKQADKARRPIDWKPEDMVYVRKGAWRTDRPHDGLDNPYMGPYRVVRQVNENAFEIDLPPGVRARRVINASRLVRAPENPVPGQRTPPPPPIEVDGVPEWEVNRILSSRVARGKLEYQAEWTGHDPDPMWYPAGNFKGFAMRIKEFHGANPAVPGPPRRLQQWIDAAADDLELADHEEDDFPVDGSSKRIKRRRKVSS